MLHWALPGMLHQGFINSAGMQARATCAGQACNMPSSSAIAAQPGYVRRWLATPCASSAAVGPHPRCCAAPVPRLPHLRQLRAPVERCAGAGDFYPSAPELPPTGMGMPDDRMGETARKALARATFATKRYGWISFWVQLTLSVVSAVILLFSVAFTSQVWLGGIRNMHSMVQEKRSTSTGHAIRCPLHCCLCDLAPETGCPLPLCSPPCSRGLERPST